MTILSQLSSQTGDQTEASNRHVAAHCVEQPDLLLVLGEGLTSSDQALVGDCAEVFTKVAEQKPKLIASFADQLIGLFNHKSTRVRWEAMHAISLIAPLVPEQIAPVLSKLSDMIQGDKSTIVRDYAIDCLGNYAKASVYTAQEVYPILKSVLPLWNEKHLARVLVNLCHVVKSCPSLGLEILPFAQDYSEHNKSSVKKAAKRLVKGALL
ncbi:hypothetical protein [Brevibacillus sp. SYSU BS000544]|uniref:hypothetical protein n=1 Tax=Brevibacillus sp. SYSU BS000544 TaxID=3416443 RepID=UPI003CE53B8D